METQRGWGLPLLVLVSGMFMSVLDTSIVNVAVPTIERAFGSTTTEVAWIVTAYTLVLGVVVPLSAWLSDRFGATRVYCLALIAFGAASALCGLAWDLNSLILFRIVQAIPGGLLPPLSMAILYRIVPPAKIGRAMGLFGLGVVGAPAVGPTLGGYLVEYVDWRLIFFINVPIGLFATLATLRFLPTFRPEGRPTFDAVGFASIATGLSALLLALSEGESWGWTSFRVVALLSLAVLMIALFVVVELEVDQPLLDVRAFQHWQFTNSMILISALSIGLFVVLFYIPVFLQTVQGLGAFEAGVVLLPQALIMAVILPIAGQLYDRIGPRWPALAGLAVCAYGTYLLHDLTINTSKREITLILMFRAAGMALAMMPIMTGGLAAVPPDKVASASAFNNVTQQGSAALGLAILGAILTASTAQFVADQAALITSDTPIPPLGSGPSGDMHGLYLAYTTSTTQAFIGALDNLMMLTTLLTLAALVLATSLRSGSAEMTNADGTRVVAMH